MTKKVIMKDLLEVYIFLRIPMNSEYHTQHLIEKYRKGIHIWNYGNYTQVYCIKRYLPYFSF